MGMGLLSYGIAMVVVLGVRVVRSGIVARMKMVDIPEAFVSTHRQSYFAHCALEPLLRSAILRRCPGADVGARRQAHRVVSWAGALQPDSTGGWALEFVDAFGGSGTWITLIGGVRCKACGTLGARLVDQPHADVAQRRAWTLELMSMWTKHVHVPVALGSRASGVAQQVHALAHAISMETSTMRDFQFFMLGVRSITVDMGSVIGCVDAPSLGFEGFFGEGARTDKAGPVLLEDEVGASCSALATSDSVDSAIAGQTELFQYAIVWPGLMHITSNMTQRLLENLGIEGFRSRLACLASFLHAQHTRDRLLATCFADTPPGTFDGLFRMGCPLLAGGRWQILGSVLEYILHPERQAALQAHWSLNRYGNGKGVTGACANVDRDSTMDAEFGISLVGVDEAITDLAFWATAHMLSNVNRTVRELEGWCESCACHPGEYCGASASQRERAWKDFLKASENEEQGDIGPGVVQRVVGETTSSQCPMRGRRAPELAAGEVVGRLAALHEQHGVVALLPHLVGLSAADRQSVLHAQQVARQHVQHELAMKTAFARRIPHLLVGLGHWDQAIRERVAQQAVYQYDQALDHTAHHRVSVIFLDPRVFFRKHVERIIAGTELSCEMPEGIGDNRIEQVTWVMFQRACRAYAMVPTIERTIEAKHAVTRRHERRAPYISPAYVSFQLRRDRDTHGCLCCCPNLWCNTHTMS